MRSKIQIKRLEGKKLDICRIFEGLFIEWKSLLHLGPTISLLKGGYGGAIFCFKVILLDTFLEPLTPLLARTRPMSRIVCFTRSSVPEENRGRIRSFTITENSSFFLNFNMESKFRKAYESRPFSKWILDREINESDLSPYK